MQKIDYKKELGKLYKPSATKMEMVTVPQLNYLAIDGEGDPNNSQQFQDAISALYTVAYTLKFMIKKGPQQVDYGVMPLEGLWWTDNMANFTMEDKSQWKWTLMILQPYFITPEMVAEAKAAAMKKKSLPLPDALRLETMNERLCAQVLYTGPYSGEPPTIVKLHEFIQQQGYSLHGRHREIYLNDMRRTAPEKLKTIIRQPVAGPGL